MDRNIDRYLAVYERVLLETAGTDGSGGITATYEAPSLPHHNRRSEFREALRSWIRDARKGSFKP